MLSEPFLDLVARRLQAISEPTRIRLLTMLESRDATVQELADELGTTRQNASKHLAVLYQCGVVTRRKDGSKVWYSLADYSACRLIEQATASVVGYVQELAGIAGLEDAA
jgi:DNA-binding transcriptional ArsR family regulator